MRPLHCIALHCIGCKLVICDRFSSRERARKAADQRRAEDDLSSLTCYWTNTVLPGAQSVSIHLRNWQWWLIFIKLIFFPPQTGSESGNQGKHKVFGGEVCNL